MGYDAIAARGKFIARELGLPDWEAFTGHWPRPTTCVCVLLCRLYFVQCDLFMQEALIAEGASIIQLLETCDWSSLATAQEYMRHSLFNKVICKTHLWVCVLSKK